MRFTQENIQELQPNEIFVFGSNLRGYHGAGAAKTALQFGAQMEQGVGEFGQTYALPTKDGFLQTLPLTTIKHYVDVFIKHASMNPEKTYLVTRVGCNLAGYTDPHIAPLFVDALNYKNIVLPQSFYDIITKPPFMGQLDRDFELFQGEPDKITKEHFEDLMMDVVDHLNHNRKEFPQRFEFKYNGRIEAHIYY